MTIVSRDKDEDEIEVNEYVRTDRGYIFKVDEE